VINDLGDDITELWDVHHEAIGELEDLPESGHEQTLLQTWTSILATSLGSGISIFRSSLKGQQVGVRKGGGMESNAHCGRVSS
jgi:hypothetical protein